MKFTRGWFQMWSLLIVFCIGILVSGCGKKEQPPLDPANMDLSVKPGDDFYQYANGTWIANNPIPDEYSRYGVFEQLVERNSDDLLTLMESAAAEKKAATGSASQKIGDFYATGMDSAKVEADGLQPIKPLLAEVAALETVEQVQSMVAQLHTMGISSLFNFFGSTDEKNSSMVIAQLMQGGLGMPDRDYYLGEDARSKTLRAEYLDHLSKMFILMGEDTVIAAEAADAVMALETRLATASMTRLERRDPHKTYHKMVLKELERWTPGFAFNRYFDSIGFAEPGEINVRQPDFFVEVSRVLRDVPVKDWKKYLSWNIINNTAAYLSSDFVNQDFAFYGKALSGRKIVRPRWKRVLGATTGTLGEMVGQLYVEKYFPAEAKARMLKLVGNLKVSLGEHIANVDWMTDQTKEKAAEKLDVMRVKVGYPDKWIDYASLSVTRDSYVGNMMAGWQFDFNYNLDKVGKPVDKDEWHMFPQTVNAYYNPTNNEIVFPAAILQPPFFNMDADDAVNYGAIGMVIGHEMTHGFDDQGRNFDKEGNLKGWWTDTDVEMFNERSHILVEQFNNYVLLDS
ncbi:M13 family peptidase, partial [bacterium]|nr:M13 family peptidase [bacterium]